jgi:hypothetical protein
MAESKQERKPVILQGTGADPLGRYPFGARGEYSPADAEELMQAGYAVPVGDAPQPPDLPVFEQHADDAGALRMDRRLTPTEAAEVDVYHRHVLVQNRQTRFLRGGKRAR